MNINYGKISLVLVSIGAINWALSMNNMNLFSIIKSKQVRTIVYYFIALAAAYLLFQILINKKETFTAKVAGRGLQGLSNLNQTQTNAVLNTAAQKAAEKAAKEKAQK